MNKTAANPHTCSGSLQAPPPRRTTAKIQEPKKLKPMLRMQVKMAPAEFPSWMPSICPTRFLGHPGSCWVRYLVLDRLYRENNKRLSQKDKDKGTVRSLPSLASSSSPSTSSSSSSSPLVPSLHHHHHHHHHHCYHCNHIQHALGNNYQVKVVATEVLQTTIRACFGMISR